MRVFQPWSIAFGSAPTLSVLGRITIGDGALIGPGAYVTFDVPSNAVVIGNPGRIVSEAGTAAYIDNILDD